MGNGEERQGRGGGTTQPARHSASPESSSVEELGSRRWGNEDHTSEVSQLRARSLRYLSHHPLSCH